MSHLVFDTRDDLLVLLRVLEEIRNVKESVPFEADIHESGLHTRQNTGDTSLVNTTCEGIFFFTLVKNLDQAADLANAIAAEHVEIMTSDPESVAARIRNAGAIFLGAHTPEAIGDYVGGSNHVLPTARSARFSSGLGVLDFMKRTSILKCGPDQLRALGPAAMTLGKADGLDAHARSVGLRLNQS